MPLKCRPQRSLSLFVLENRDVHEAMDILTMGEVMALIPADKRQHVAQVAAALREVFPKELPLDVASPERQLDADDIPWDS